MWHSAGFNLKLHLLMSPNVKHYILILIQFKVTTVKWRETGDFNVLTNPNAIHLIQFTCAAPSTIERKFKTFQIRIQSDAIQL